MRRFARVLILPLALMVASPAAHAQSIFKDAGSILKGLGGSCGSSSLSNAEIGGGLRDALRVGTETVTGNLGSTNGFFNDPVAHIPLPGWMNTAKKVMRFTGGAGLLDEVELRMNRAAEGSMDEAKQMFGDAIEQMTIDDARGILTGPDDSATRYFEGKMTNPLSAKMRPIVERELSSTNAFAAYDRAAASAGGAALAPEGKNLMVDHAVEKALKGLFHYIAKEEAAIRNNPAKRVTPLLQKVFG
jgi:hypothetical protein